LFGLYTNSKIINEGVVAIGVGRGPLDNIEHAGNFGLKLLELEISLSIPLADTDLHSDAGSTSNGEVLVLFWAKTDVLCTGQLGHLTGTNLTNVAVRAAAADA
jgi:hypothetical protein